MKPTLLILAAGMASRYGSMKQTEAFGPSGETIMDYSIFDAIRAGFGKVVFIIRKDFADNFKAAFDPKLKGKIEVEYVYQELDKFVPKEFLPADRVKPWGTGHAILCAKDVINEPFAVINADDFYGANAFQLASDFLKEKCDENNYCIIGYPLRNTLSKHGTVSRGVCEVNQENHLVSITERTKILENENGIVYQDENGETVLNPATNASMNFWCFHQNFFKIAEELFEEFLKNHSQEPKSEFFIPIIADYFMKELGGNIIVIPTTSKWFGVTYKEDAPTVKESLNSLIDAGEYHSNIWSN